LCICFSYPVHLAAQTTVDLATLQDEAIHWLQEYIGVNTINPPGNEIAGARYIAGIFEAEGIEYEIAESEPGRGNIWAWLDGGDEPGLMLLHHIDVVPADEKFWNTDPLSGELMDGYIYGRGTLDTKTSGILHLAAFIALHRSGIALNRKVLYMATADEEAGGAYGAGWLVENQPELFRDIGYLLNEGGGGVQIDGNVQFGVEVTQKVPYWLRLSATGPAGHGSNPSTSYASLKLIEALERLRLHEFEPNILPVMDEYFKEIADQHPEPWRTRFGDMESAVLEAGVLQELQDYDPGLHRLTRNTCSITRFQGSNKINVVSPEVWAEVDCRLLPDQDPEQWLEEMRQVLGDEIEIEVLMGFTPAVSSSNTDLYRTMKQVVLEAFPEARFVPTMMGGFTDSHFFRDLGIVSYGFQASTTPREDLAGVHGNNERVLEASVRQGVAMTLRILERFAAKGSVLED
jgi:acetylornithine deacetylase/succinyl-diaminopimelate desuccinylase-like protein